MISVQADMLENRLRKRARHLSKWARRQGITCYRVYDRDIPEIALAIDRYEDHLHIACYRRHSTQPPDSGDFAQDAVDGPDAQWLNAMVERAARVLEVPASRVHVKERRRQRGTSQYQRLEHTERYVTAGEGGLCFAVNLDDYLDTGLFLDHRLTRARVRDEARGARFLNLFCYTGAFTVYAAAGGARSTVSVDLSNRYLDWAERNLALNGLSGARHELVRADVLELLRDRPKEPFDLAVLDPPTFSASKKMHGVLDTQRDHVELIGRTLDWLRPGGVLYFSTNYRRFKLDQERIRAAGIEDITRATLPDDFRDSRAHRCWRIVK